MNYFFVAMKFLQDGTPFYRNAIYAQDEECFNAALPINDLFDDFENAVVVSIEHYPIPKEEAEKIRNKWNSILNK